MYLQNLSLLNFRNIEEAELKLEPGINCFIGKNGQGKTNLLDAVYYLSFCKSYFNPVDTQNIRHGQDFFVVQGTFRTGGVEDHIYCAVKKGSGKVFKKNKKEYEKLADHIGLFPLVMISPYDADLVNEGSELRRKFVDVIISQFNRPYLENLQQYNRVLKQRNILLKNFYDTRSFEPAMLEVYNEQLAQLGQPIYEARGAFLEAFRPRFIEFYGELSKADEQPDVCYESQLKEHGWAELFQASLPRDRQTQFTNMGVHKDDLSFQLDGHPIKRFGSQGQQKTFLIALKLTQFYLVKERLNKTPLLLLDDIFDKIDESRLRYLMGLIRQGDFGQIFITDTEMERVEKILEEVSASAAIFTVTKGAIVHETDGQHRTGQ